MAKSQSRDESNARLIHRYLKRNLPAEKDVICSALGIEPEHFDSAVRFSRKTNDPETIVNEIVAVTKSYPFLYYLAKTSEQAQGYRQKRIRTIDGHLDSVEILLQKELDKWPEKAIALQTAITQVERVRHDLQVVYGL